MQHLIDVDSHTDCLSKNEFESYELEELVVAELTQNQLIVGNAQSGSTRSLGTSHFNDKVSSQAYCDPCIFDPREAE